MKLLITVILLFGLIGCETELTADTEDSGTSDNSLTPAVPKSKANGHQSGLKTDVDSAIPAKQEEFSLFLTKCHAAINKMLVCTNKIESIGQGSMPLMVGDINIPAPQEETEACFTAYDKNIEEAIQTLPEETQQLARKEHEELFALSQESDGFPIADFSPCYSKPTDKEKYICANTIYMNAAKEKFCKVIEVLTTR